METNLSKRPPSNPFAPPAANNRQLSSLNKGALYDEADLRNLLQVHSQLSDALLATNQPQSEQDEEDLITKQPSEEDIQWNPSLHDRVLEILQSNNHNNGVKEPISTTTTPSITDNASTSWLDETFRAKISQIRAIASDVDGTILSSQQSIHPRTRRAILDAVQYCRDPQHALQYFFLATGKSQKGAMDSLGIQVASQLSNLPGVFLQGLYCIDAQGKVVFEQKLTPAAVEAAEQLANQWDMSLIAYDGNHLYTTKQTPVVLALNTRYGEPPAQLLDTLTGFAPGFHKILIMDDHEEKVNTLVRPQLEALQESFGATVTQAIPTMLEWLPAGCSKGLGVRKVCEALGIHPETQLLAIGDAENDLAMLRMAAIGVAVGNASPLAQEAADFVLEETNDQGGAGVAMELFAFGRATSNDP
jgi:Cof subfamily protein (haloacid dehalogenase superfamily)